MDLVSKLVPVTENLKNGKDGIAASTRLISYWKRWNCGDEKKLTWQKSSHEKLEKLHCTGRADACLGDLLLSHLQCEDR